MVAYDEYYMPRMPSIPWNPFGFGSTRPRRFPRMRRGGKRQKIAALKQWKIVRGDTVIISMSYDSAAVLCFCRCRV